MVKQKTKTMKKLYILAIAYFLFCNISKSQEVWTWAKAGGGDTTDCAYEVATDLLGNIFVTGSFLSDTMILGNDTLVNNGSYDVFISKYDSDGNVLWAKNFGDSNADNGMSVATDATGNAYITGYFLDTIFFGTDTLVSLGDNDIFLVKYDPNGNPLWGVKGGGNNVDKSSAMYIDANDNVYITGRFYSSSANYGTEVITNTSGGTDDILIVKYDSNGNVIWAKNAGGTNHDQAYGITADVFGNVYVTGWFYSNSITFGTTTINNNGFIDYYILKFNSAGNPVWAKSAGSGLEDEGFGVTTDSLGYVYVTGNFHSTSIVFDTITLTSKGDRDMFICKYDTSGNIMWAKNTGGTLQDRGENIAVDTSGHILVAGWFYSTSMIFASDTLQNFNGNDMFVVKYDTSGSEIWAKNAGGSTDDLSNSLAIDNANNIYVGGYFISSNMTFGTNIINNNGHRDYYLAKISECAVNLTLYDTLSICQGDTMILDAGSGNGYAYIWSSGETTQTIAVDTAGLYWVEVIDANNCVNSDTSFVILNPVPIVNLGQDTIICDLWLTSLDAGNVGSSYLWSTGDTSQTLDFYGYSLPLFNWNIIWVEVDNGNCISSDTILIWVDACMDINKIESDDIIKIYPNPTTGTITVEAVDIENIEVLDIKGRQVYQGKETEIDLSPQPKGIYIIKVTTEKSVVVGKVVLE